MWRKERLDGYIIIQVWREVSKTGMAIYIYTRVEARQVWPGGKEPKLFPRIFSLCVAFLWLFLPLMCLALLLKVMMFCQEMLRRCIRDRDKDRTFIHRA